MWIALPVLIIVISLACFNGLVMYAVYADCDPLTVGEIQRNDQVKTPPFTRASRKKEKAGLVLLLLSMRDCTL